KLAAFEGLGETRRGVSVHLLGWYSHGRVEYGIPVPRLLSLLAYHDPNARVAGLDAVRADERPPVNVVRIAFQTMVGIGTLLTLLGLAFLAVRWRRKRLPESRWFYGALVLAGPLSVVALICGWVTTEVGRQPWVVYRVMRTSQAVTGAGGIPVGYPTRALATAFALPSFLTPRALGAAIGGIASRRIPVGNAAADQSSSWLNPTSLLLGVLAVVPAASLAAVFLCADAARLGDPGLERKF